MVPGACNEMFNLALSRLATKNLEKVCEIVSVTLMVENDGANVSFWGGGYIFT